MEKGKSSSQRWKPMITRSNLADQLKEYQTRSKNEWASVSFFSSTSNLNSSRRASEYILGTNHQFVEVLKTNHDKPLD